MKEQEPYFHQLTLDGNIEGVIEYLINQKNNLNIKNSKNLSALANLICELAKAYDGKPNAIKSINNSEIILKILLKYRQENNEDDNVKTKEDKRKKKFKKTDIEIYYLAQLFWSNNEIYQELINDPQYINASQAEKIEYIRKKLEEITPITDTKKFVEKLIEIERAVMFSKAKMLFQETLFKLEQKKNIEQLAALANMEGQRAQFEQAVQVQKEKYLESFTLMYELIKTLSNHIKFDKTNTVWGDHDKVFDICPNFSDINFEKTFEKILNPNIKSLTLNDNGIEFVLPKNGRENTVNFLSGVISDLRIEKNPIDLANNVCIGEGWELKK